MDLDPIFSGIFENLVPREVELKALRASEEPWKNEELYKIALRIMRFVVPRNEAERTEKWAIIDTLHEIDRRAVVGAQEESCQNPTNAQSA